MLIESRFDLIDSVISAMRGQSERMLNIISGVDNPATNVPDITGTGNYMDSEPGSSGRRSLIDMDNEPVRMTNLLVAAKAYEANVGVLGRYKQMTETKLELLG